MDEKDVDEERWDFRLVLSATSDCRGVERVGVTTW